MICNEIKNRIVARYYGEITDKEKYDIEMHLIECDNCKQYYRQISQLLNETTKNRDFVPQPNWDTYLDEIYQKLTRREVHRVKEKSEVKYPSKIFSRQLIPVGAVALVLITLGGYTLGNNLWQQYKEKQEIKEIINDMEMYQNMELLQDLDVVENCDEIQDLDKI